LALTDHNIATALNQYRQQQTEEVTNNPNPEVK
jgi:phosphoribosylcarboxyaminoimidazole (NCAIR) mutase